MAKIWLMHSSSSSSSSFFYFVIHSIHVCLFVCFLSSIFNCLASASHFHLLCLLHRHHAAMLHELITFMQSNNKYNTFLVRHQFVLLTIKTHHFIFSKWRRCHFLSVSHLCPHSLCLLFVYCERACTRFVFVIYISVSIAYMFHHFVQRSVVNVVCCVCKCVWCP